MQLKHTSNTGKSAMNSTAEHTPASSPYSSEYSSSIPVPYSRQAIMMRMGTHTAKPVRKEHTRVLTLLPTKMPIMPAEKVRSGVMTAAFSFTPVTVKLEKWSIANIISAKMTFKKIAALRPSSKRASSASIATGREYTLKKKPNR